MNTKKKGRRTNIVELPRRLLGNHYPSIVPSILSRAKPQRKLIVSQNKNNKRKDTTYMCVKCNIGLCPAPCFEIYHTQNKYF